MTRLLLVRHARPAATWEESIDAPLDPVGVRQAEEAAERLALRGPMPVVTSPLRRARETAAPLARRWATEARVVDQVGEVPSPPVSGRGGDLASRGAWLRDVLTKSWPDVGPALHDWRERLLEALSTFEADTVVFTHYVAINTVVGAATGDERLVCCDPGHASITEVRATASGGLRLVGLDGDRAAHLAPPR